MWYARASIERLLDSPIDLLLVDGPPAQDPRHRTDRYPAAGFFRPALHTDSLVVLDDVSRSGEAEIVKRWEAEQGLRLRTFEALRLAAGRLGRVGLLY
jgi:predicted O-methyltransferase YrrM